MKEKRYTEFDKTEVVETKIKPLIAKIEKICKEKDIPFFISIAQKGTKDKTDYYSVALTNDNRIECDNQALIKEEFVPLIADLKRDCTLENIPFFISFVEKIKADKKNKGSFKIDYYNDGNMPGSIPMSLHDDNFSKYLLVLRGAYVTLIKNKDEELQEYINQNIVEDEDDDIDIDMEMNASADIPKTEAEPQVTYTPPKPDVILI